MSNHEQIIAINILDRVYKIKCQPEQTTELQASATFLDEEMRKVRQHGSTMSTDRIAVVTSLNLAHDLLVLQKQKSGYFDHVNDKIKELQLKIQNALATEPETTL